MILGGGVMDIAGELVDPFISANVFDRLHRAALAVVGVLCLEG